jgi:hypothetical protein
MFTIDFTGSPEDIDAILALLKHQDGVEEVAEPTRLDASRALNVGLPHDPITILHFITVVFQTGTAALVFYKALRDELRQRGSAVAVSEPATGKSRGRIDAGTADETLNQLAS